MTTQNDWKILSVDDDLGVHQMLEIVLQDFLFDNHPVQILKARSFVEAINLIKQNPDIALTIIDVVMETPKAGLELVQYIRNDLLNSMMRLIVRTGQTENFPEDELITDFEINDYWEKSQMSLRRIKTSITVSLRNYKNLIEINQKVEQLKTWSDRFPDFLHFQDWMGMARLMAIRFFEIFPEKSLSLAFCGNEGSLWPLLMGTGRFPSTGAPDILPFLNESLAQGLLKAWENHQIYEIDMAIISYFETSIGKGFLILIENAEPWKPFDRIMINLMLQNLRGLLENRILMEQLAQNKLQTEVTLHKLEPLFQSLHHYFGEALQLLTSLSSYSNETLFNLQRRIKTLIDLHFLLRSNKAFINIDFHQYMLFYIKDIQRKLDYEEKKLKWNYWGVPLQLDYKIVVPLLFLLDEIFTDIQELVGRRELLGQVKLSDDPRQISLKLPIKWDPTSIAEHLIEYLHAEIIPSQDSDWSWIVAF